ncbi:hypothetical protein [Tepidibacillus fermentans]|uniref:Lipoprotein n=1 Tax=Tepidibacillus fermentans TaxID=1281767 RepID=A0A4R3K6S6_9BACI|nr:hypothetical protein [Tepidibacillus fermentans]TCS78626.1 hypothetical protein EDD72_1264 [Tepidibacillus fermentans]
MIKKLFKTYFLVVLLLVACDNNEYSKQISNHHSSKEMPNQIEKNKEHSKKDDSTNSSGKNLTLEKKFLPPNFLVKKIEIEAKNHSLTLVMNYVLSEKLYEILKQYKDYYFVIQYPEEFSTLTNVKNSKPVKGPLPTNGQLSYSVTFLTSWSNDIPKDLINKINNGELRYNLIILDKEMFPVHIFNDVQWYQTFDPNKGSNIIFDEKKNEKEN